MKSVAVKVLRNILETMGVAVFYGKLLQQKRGPRRRKRSSVAFGEINAKPRIAMRGST
ncbi:MAG: hypothetical protein FWD61_09105 [Phycisphaerales bacterium]|nr:hypothetical protein [Phycisphaerales bacterium]